MGSTVTINIVADNVVPAYTIGVSRSRTRDVKSSIGRAVIYKAKSGTAIIICPHNVVPAYPISRGAISRTRGIEGGIGCAVIYESKTGTAIRISSQYVVTTYTIGVSRSRT